MSLGEALDALEKNEVIKRAMPDEMYRVFMHYKRDEWEKFIATVTNWDLQQYWDYPAVRSALGRRRQENDAMCGIAGLIHRGKTGDIGTEMTTMLQSLKHRGPDSTGFALYGQPKGNELVLRFKVAEQEDMTKGFDIHRR